MDVLRTNWEVRCVLGNLATVMLAQPTSSSRDFFQWFMKQSFDINNWDYAQVLFDGLHHVPQLNHNEELFLLDIASTHPNEQARWNVGTALKSMPLTGERLREIIAILLSDGSEWVRKGVIEQACKSTKLRKQLTEGDFIHALQESFGNFPRLAEYALLAESETNDESTFASIIRSMSSDLISTDSDIQFLLMDELELGKSALPLYFLREDLHLAYSTKSQFKAQHGSLYAASEKAVLNRLSRLEPDVRRDVYWTYLRSPDETFAWVCSKLVFHPVIVECGDQFIQKSLSVLLDNSLEWIVRECVEGIVRLPEGYLKNLAIEEITRRRSQLKLFREVRPYLPSLTELGG